MPNGRDKNYRRLLMACAAYRSRYGDWPAEARMSAGMLQDLARLLNVGAVRDARGHAQAWSGA